MSDAVAAMRTYLKTQSGVTDLCGGSDARIYYGNLPQNPTLPAVVLEQTGDDIQRKLAGATTLRRTRINVHAYAESQPDAAALADALATAIEFGSGTWDTMDVRRALVEGVVDASEPLREGRQAFRNVRSLLTVVWHN